LKEGTECGETLLKKREKSTREGSQNLDGGRSNLGEYQTRGKEGGGTDRCKIFDKSGEKGGAPLYGSLLLQLEGGVLNLA